MKGVACCILAFGISRLFLFLYDKQFDHSIKVARCVRFPSAQHLSIAASTSVDGVLGLILCGKYS